MSSFSLVEPTDYVAILLARLPAFQSSEEYRRLDEDDRKYSGLVFSAFAQFMERLPIQCDTFQSCVDAVEHFATMNDAEAENLIVTEVFEALDRPAAIVARLHPKSKELYERWLGG